MNAFIVAQQRTGSTLLYEFLDSHPGIFCADELFIIKGKVDYRFRMIKVYDWYRRKKGMTPDQFINWIFSLSQNSCMKLLYHQIDYFKLYNRVFNTPIIHLSRRNHFKRVVSLWSTVGNINIKKPDQFIEEMKAAIRRERMWEDTLKKRNNKKQLRLYYEDLVGRNEIVREINYTFIKEDIGKKLCQFFGVPYFEMFTATQKALSKKDYWEYIPEKHREVIRKKLEANFSEEVWK